MNTAQVIAETHNWMQTKVQRPGVYPLEFTWLDGQVNSDGTWITVDDWLFGPYIADFMNAVPNETIDILDDIKTWCAHGGPDFVEFGKTFYRTFHSRYVYDTDYCECEPPVKLT